MARLFAASASMTVRQKALIVIGLGLAPVILAIVVTAVLTSAATAFVLWGSLIAAVLLAARFAPISTAGIKAHPDPAPDPGAAAARFAAYAASPRPLNPLCHPEILDHGGRTRLAVVLLHGVSSCPRAFVDFAPQLHARGHTVISLRMPENGYADRATDAMKAITAERLAAWGDTAVDIAAGFGDEVAVLGISAGGTVAAWVGQTRPEVARAVLVAPMFGLGGLGAGANRAIMRLALSLPDISIWKDPVLRASFEGMPHAYKRQSSRATGEIMRLGHAAFGRASASRAAASAGALVTNDADTAVSNPMAERFAAAWVAHGLPVARVVFDASHRLGHELIDPLEPGSDPALTYPVLIDLLEGGTGAASAALTDAATSRTVMLM